MALTSSDMKRLRERLGLNMIDFGKRIGVTGQAISQIESGKRAVTRQTELLCGFVARDAGVRSITGQRRRKGAR